MIPPLLPMVAEAEKADKIQLMVEDMVGELVQYMQSDLVAKSDLEQSIVDVVQKRFGIEPSQ